jgi:transcriptional regulator with XRE-family HTH domain
MENKDLLDMAKSRANLPSDYALAKVLGITPGNLSNIRKNKAHPSNEVAIKLATLAGIDELRVIAEIELRTANSEKKKAFWTHYIESRSLAGCLAMTALAATLLITPESAKATETNILQLQDYGTYNHAQATKFLYIMRIIEISSQGNKSRIFVVFQLIAPGSETIA